MSTSILVTWSVWWNFQTKKVPEAHLDTLARQHLKVPSGFEVTKGGIGSKCGLKVVREFVYPLEVQQFAPEKMVVGRRWFPIGRLRFVWVISNLGRVRGAKNDAVEIWGLVNKSFRRFPPTETQTWTFPASNAWRGEDTGEEDPRKWMAIDTQEYLDIETLMLNTCSTHFVMHIILQNISNSVNIFI